MAKPDQFAIFQPQDKEKKYENGAYAEMVRQHHLPTRTEYTQVYTAPLPPGATPYKLMQMFTTHLPEGVQGHTVRIGDIIVVRQNGSITAYFIDLGTLIVLPDFFPPRKNSLDASVGVNEKSTVNNRKSLKKNLADKKEAVKQYKPPEETEEEEEKDKGKDKGPDLS